MADRKKIIATFFGVISPGAMRSDGRLLPLIPLPPRHTDATMGLFRHSQSVSHGHADAAIMPTRPSALAAWYGTPHLPDIRPSIIDFSKRHRKLLAAGEHYCRVWRSSCATATATGFFHQRVVMPLIWASLITAQQLKQGHRCQPKPLMRRRAAPALWLFAIT